MSSHGHANSGRVAQLDSLRGIAAMTVVWYHWHSAIYIPKVRWYLAPFFAGHEAVILFFVLSGYVLSLPTWTKRTAAYPEYLVRRVSRIYLPYLAAAFLAGIGCYFYCGSRLPLTPWFYATWQTPLSAQVVWQQFVMDPRSVLNTAFWSLRYEMQMSLVFPFLCLLMMRTGRHSGIAMVAATCLVSYLTLRTPFGSTDLAQTVYYAIFFVAGAALAREQKVLNQYAARMSKPALWAALVVSFVAYSYSSTILKSQRWSGLLTGAGTLGLIFLIQDPRMHLGLKSAVPEYLGRISYSLYLLHGTVLFGGMNLLYGKVPLPALAVLYAVASVAVAHVFCVLVEEPSLRLGKRVAKWMKETRAERKLQAARVA
jgi:peptidoglycan/LPS O-acetylase OafA/YrhL